MGLVDDLMVVVDNEGCVYGLQGLCVVDVLIMLCIVIGNLNVLMIMIVEKIVDWICGVVLFVWLDVVFYVYGKLLLQVFVKLLVVSELVVV